MESNAFGTTSAYTAFMVGKAYGTNGANGGLYCIGRYYKSATVASEPFVGFCGWDSGSQKILYFGGSNWLVPDANNIRFYTIATYTDGTGGTYTAPERARFDGEGRFLLGTSSTTLSQLLVASDSAWFAGDVSALSFTDRSDAPEDLEEARAIVSSIEAKNGKVDHSKLHPKAWGTRVIKEHTGEEEFDKIEDGKVFWRERMIHRTEPDQSGRNLSMVISAQALVIKDLEKRLADLEKKVGGNR
jgi:hypothetical protein